MRYWLLNVLSLHVIKQLHVTGAEKVYECSTIRLHQLLRLLMLVSLDYLSLQQY